MKKIVSFSIFIVTIVVFILRDRYEQWPFDYQVAQVMDNLFLWLLSLFILSLFSFTLETKKYKIWLSVTLLFSLLSIYWAYRIGDGSGSLISFDGETTTWLLVGLYSFISLIYFIIQYFKNQKKEV